MGNYVKDIFKKGYKVKYCGDDPRYKGCCGEVLDYQFTDNCQPVKVQWDNDTWNFFEPHELITVDTPFEKGDRVKYVGENSQMLGKHGTVQSVQSVITESSKLIKVKFDNGLTHNYYPRNLKRLASNFDKSLFTVGDRIVYRGEIDCLIGRKGYVSHYKPEQAERPVRVFFDNSEHMWLNPSEVVVIELDKPQPVIEKVVTTKTQALNPDYFEVGDIVKYKRETYPLCSSSEMPETEISYCRVSQLHDDGRMTIDNGEHYCTVNPADYTAGRLKLVAKGVKEQ